MNNFATSQGHWYQQDGSPIYTLIGKNGKERNTTLRDARKEGYLPSVTTIINQLDKPGLNRWKQNQVMMAALTLPKVEGETLTEFEARAWADSEKHSIEARDRGTAIHGAVENFYLTGNVNQEFETEIFSTSKVLLDTFGLQEWNTEKSVSHKSGFGGKVDLNSDTVIVDYKTKDFDADSLPKGYDEQCMQLAAYRQCINPKAECANVYISRNNSGLVHLHRWTNEELERGWKMFTLLLELWKLTKGYDSGFED